MTRYKILVIEPWDFKWPDSQTSFLADLVGILSSSTSSDKKRYLLLKVVYPFQYEGELVEQMIASPRFVGTTIDMISNAGGIVGLARVHPGVSLIVNTAFKPSDVQYFVIADLKLL